MSVIGTLLEDDGLKVRTGFSFEVKQAKSESKTTGTLDVKHADLGGAKAALAVSAEFLINPKFLPELQIPFPRFDCSARILSRYKLDIF